MNLFLSLVSTFDSSVVALRFLFMGSIVVFAEDSTMTLLGITEDAYIARHGLLRISSSSMCGLSASTILHLNWLVSPSSLLNSVDFLTLHALRPQVLSSTGDFWLWGCVFAPLALLPRLPLEV